MYKLVNVVVDSDAYEKTYEFRAIVKQDTDNSYENIEAKNVLLDVLSLNDVFEVKLRGKTQRTDMVELNRLVQTDDKFVDGLYVSFRNCNKNAYSFTDLLRDDATVELDWHDIDVAADIGTVSEASTVFGKIMIVKIATESGSPHYRPVLDSQQFKETILRDFSASFSIVNAKAHAETLLLMAKVALLFDPIYDKYDEFLPESVSNLEDNVGGVLNTRVGKVYIEDIVMYPAYPGRVYSCKLLLPWSCGVYNSMYNVDASYLPVAVDLLIKKKINVFLNKIKFI